MSMQMADPYEGLVSFQQCLRAGVLEVNLVPKHTDLYSHFDVPAPGEARFTYARLSDDRKEVMAFLACIKNGTVDSFPCVSVGYAVPETMRNQGFAKQIFRDVIQDQVTNAGRSGIARLYIEAMVDVTNQPSQRVAEAVLGVERESVVDSASSRPAYRYTACFDTASGRQL